MESVLGPASALNFPTPRLPESTIALRREVREFIAAERDAGRIGTGVDVWLSGHDAAFSQRLGDRGWIGMTWPREYGGAERSMLERYVVTEELLAAGAPVAAHWVADRQTGPLLLRHGTERQRRRFLPSIAQGRCYFAIGMSEPDSGSDLASVRMHARRRGGHWIVNGTKVWTSNAHHAHFAIMLCRTSARSKDRHAGLGQLIVDLRAPGVTIRPILAMAGQHHFDEVVLEDVRVPEDMLVGREGDGWHQVMSELAYERSGPERFLSTLPLLVELVRCLGREGGDPAGVGRLVAHLRALRRLSLAVAARLQAGERPEVEAALVKDLGTRFEYEVIETARRAAPRRPSADAADPLAALLASSVLAAPGFTLRGGTTEILRGIIARALGVR